VQWSPDCRHIAAGAINCKAEIISLSSRAAISLTGHTSYVQGIAWDPFNKMVVTQSADRSCRVHQVPLTHTCTQLTRVRITASSRHACLDIVLPWVTLHLSSQLKHTGPSAKVSLKASSVIKMQMLASAMVLQGLQQSMFPSLLLLHKLLRTKAKICLRTRQFLVFSGDQSNSLNDCHCLT
jgi:hypothetical protein